MLCAAKRSSKPVVQAEILRVKPPQAQGAEVRLFALRSKAVLQTCSSSRNFEGEAAAGGEGALQSSLIRKSNFEGEAAAGPGSRGEAVCFAKQSGPLQTCSSSRNFEGEAAAGGEGALQSSLIRKSNFEGEAAAGGEGALQSSLINKVPTGMSGFERRSFCKFASRSPKHAKTSILKPCL